MADMRCPVGPRGTLSARSHWAALEPVEGKIEDWTLRENVRANLRRLVERILRKHGYPPDKQEKATRTVLEQAEVLPAGWAL